MIEVEAGGGCGVARRDEVRLKDTAERIAASQSIPPAPPAHFLRCFRGSSAW